MEREAVKHTFTADERTRRPEKLHIFADEIQLPTIPLQKYYGVSSNERFEERAKEEMHY